MNIRVKDISYCYNRVLALNHVSLEIRSRDMLAIIGQNGSGKSTLLKCLCRILKVREGKIELDDKPLNSISPAKLSRLVAYIPQAEEMNTTGINVFDTVLLGRKPYIRGNPTTEDFDVVASLLSRLELESVAMRNINTLSGGQQQRVFIARALAQQPSVLLLDEPIASLDIYHQMKVMQLLQQLSQEGLTIIITIHDINMAARFCNRTLMLKQGSVFASGDRSVYIPENIEHLYDIHVDVLRHKDCICVIPQNT